MHMPRWMSRFAAPQMAKKLRVRGAELLMPPEGFFVVDREGPLEEGEAERAAKWAASLREKYINSQETG
jgi:hypothetical protein